MQFEYKVKHIEVVKNVWGDLLSRWGSGKIEEPTSQAATLKMCAMVAPVAPRIRGHFAPPSLAHIKKAQEVSTLPVPTRVTRDRDGVWVNEVGAPWVPEDARELIVRICVMGHMSSVGHQGIEATQRTIGRYCFWKGMLKDIQEFVKSCLHCGVSHSGIIVPRPLGEAVHGEEVGEVVHFDFLSLPLGGWEHEVPSRDEG